MAHPPLIEAQTQIETLGALEAEWRAAGHSADMIAITYLNRALTVLRERHGGSSPRDASDYAFSLAALTLHNLSREP